MKQRSVRSGLQIIVVLRYLYKVTKREGEERNKEGEKEEGKREKVYAKYLTFYKIHVENVLNCPFINLGLF